MPRLLLPLVEKSLAIAIEEDLAALARRRPIDAPVFLQRHRMLAVVDFHQGADPARLAEWLFRAASAAVDLIASVPIAIQEPVADAAAWDAIAAGADGALVDELIGLLGAHGSRGRAGYVALRLRRGDRLDVGIATGSRWAAPVAAIASHDGEGFAAALRRALDDSLAAASADPDAALTTDRISIPGVALLKLARHRGLGTASFQHRLVPRDALLPSREPPPPRDAWRTIRSYRSFDA